MADAYVALFRNKLGILSQAGAYRRSHSYSEGSRRPASPSRGNLHLCFHCLRKSRGFGVGAVELLISVLVPLYPVVQFIHHLISTIPYVAAGEPFEWDFLLAGVCGWHTYAQIHNLDGTIRHFRAWILDLYPNELEMLPISVTRDTRYFARLAAILSNLTLLLFTTTMYLHRLHYTFRRATYCAATGWNHRSGWVALAALVPVLQSLALHISNVKWGLRPNLVHDEVRTYDLNFRLALDTMAAAVIQELLIMLTGSFTSITLIIRHFLTQENRRYLLTALLLFGSVGIVLLRPLALTLNNPNHWIRKSVSWLMLIGATAYAVLVFVLQIVVDMEEYADLRLNFVLPWNYRWQVPCPAGLRWWGL
ncbi:hypothetical protein LTR84_001492 [Exophiala bonariae]|uniref:Uncharacterized protein n=1 Tax=Exophiala bonariae TaxID=1690606 RepID=A0AAV9NEZ5_9EURO|nr:hypothetical protein LTR84_001492 [Exophiala bonariae]